MSALERNWLLYVAALALGEGLAAFFSRGAAAWPLAVILLVFVALFGFGYRLRGWTFIAFASLGLALSFHASLAREEALRRSPWLRHRPFASGGPTLRLPFADSLRGDLSRRVGWGLDETHETVHLNRAILLGERSNLPKATKKIFIESGTIHVFAISGLHVMIIARVLMFLIALLFVPYRLQGALAIPLIWGYVLLVGAPPSAVRAALMASFYFAAPLFSRRPNALLSWVFAFLLVHILNPVQIADVGSQLSFAVMLALILASRLAMFFLPSRWSGLFVAFAAWSAGVPIAAAVFGRITPGGLLANLVLLLAAGYSVIAGVLGALVSYFSSTLAVHLNNLSALLTDAMVVVSNVVARLPGSNFEVEPWGFAACALWYAVFGFGFFLLARRRARRNLI